MCRLFDHTISPSCTSRRYRILQSRGFFSVPAKQHCSLFRYLFQLPDKVHLFVRAPTCTLERSSPIDNRPEDPGYSPMPPSLSGCHIPNIGSYSFSLNYLFSSYEFSLLFFKRRISIYISPYYTKQKKLPPIRLVMLAIRSSKSLFAVFKKQHRSVLPAEPLSMRYRTAIIRCRLPIWC